jgi:hypothetical protein
MEKEAGLVQGPLKPPLLVLGLLLFALFGGLQFLELGLLFAGEEFIK